MIVYIVHHLEFFVVNLGHRFDAGAQFAFVHQVANADTDTVHLVAIAGANATTRGTDSSLASLLFFCLVEGRVVREHHVCIVGNEQATFRVDTLRVEVCNFVPMAVSSAFRTSSCLRATTRTQT